MKKLDSAYYGLIPSEVRYSKKLQPLHKLLYAEITACLDSDGVCTRNNLYFSKVLDVSKGTVSNYLNVLRKQGFINITIENEEGTMKFLNRYIVLTPISPGVGVEKSNEDTHTSDNLGVEDSSPLEDAQNSTSVDGTLLHSNNNINTIYKKHQAIYTPLNKSINDEQRNALLKIVMPFYEIQRTRHPNMINSGWSDDKDIINGSINVLYQLIKIDGYEYESVRDTIRWAIDDKFWSKNLISLRNLRSKAGNGFTKFQNLYHKYKNQ